VVLRASRTYDAYRHIDACRVAYPERPLPGPHVLHGRCLREAPSAAVRVDPPDRQHPPLVAAADRLDERDPDTGVDDSVGLRDQLAGRVGRYASQGSRDGLGRGGRQCLERVDAGIGQ
jgi:hypothetical protein